MHTGNLSQSYMHSGNRSHSHMHSINRPHSYMHDTIGNTIAHTHACILGCLLKITDWERVCNKMYSPIWLEGNKTVLNALQLEPRITNGFFHRRCRLPGGRSTWAIDGLAQFERAMNSPKPQIERASYSKKVSKIMLSDKKMDLATAVASMILLFCGLLNLSDR